jgi:hypothetical protein
LNKWLPYAARSVRGTAAAHESTPACNVLAKDAIFELRFMLEDKNARTASAMDRASVAAARPPPTVIRSKCVMRTVPSAL